MGVTPEKLPTPFAIQAENELAGLLHEWAVKWVENHSPQDRASCFGHDLAQKVVEGGVAELSELLIKAHKHEIVLVCNFCWKTWNEGHACD